MTSEVIVEEPERSYLGCEIDILKFPIEWKNVLEPLYQLFQSQVFEWKDANYPLPESLFSRFDIQRVDLGISDYLNMDECVQLSRNECGERLQLSKEQFNDLRRLGEIRVKSQQFPGKCHVWRVNRLFQKGTDETYRDFQRDLSRVIRILIITMKNRVIAKELSMRSSVRHIWKGIYLFTDLLFGIPHNNPGDIETKMEEECLQFLTCELNVYKMDQLKLTRFWDYLEQLSCLPRQCGADRLKEYFPIYTDASKIPEGVYQFTTPNRLCVDLRLMNTSLELKCYDLVHECISEVEQSNWFLEFRNSYVERMYYESLSVENMEKNVLAEGMKAKCNKIFYLIRQTCESAFIPESICNLMIENAKFYLICAEVRENYRQLWLEFKAERLESISKSHPYLSLISAWKRNQLNCALNEFLEKHQFTQLRMAIDKCASEELRQHEYFIKRYLLFQKERRQLIYHELVHNSSFPDTSYEYHSKMALPSYWKVTPSMTKDGKKCFKVDKYKRLQWTTQYPLWRWINYFMRTYMLILTIGQFLLIKLPLRTRISYLSLLRKKPFITQYNFDNTTGSISPSNLSKPIPTLCSRLVNLWNNVWKSRATFESTPLTGLLDKSVARHFHRLWVIGMKGGVGTIGIVILMPLLCVFTSSFSVIIGVLVPIWVPFVTMAIFMSSIIFYDMEPPSSTNNRLFCIFQSIIWHVLWCGLIQLCLQIVLIVVFFPALVVMALILTFLRFTIRSSWDLLVFHLILKRHAHVPAANDFMTKRISGPGLAYEYEILVMPEHVLTGLRCLMEKFELELWLKQVTMIIEAPLRNYRSFLDKALHPMNLKLNENNKNVCRLIEKETKALESVTENYNKRIAMLNISPFINQYKKERLRMSSKNLKIVLEKSEKLWQQFYPERLYPRMQQLDYNEDAWWNEMNIRKHDMKNLSLSNLSYLFGDQILSPIEECDEVFQLETNELTMKTYIDMFVTEEYHDDLDKINIISSNWNRGVSMEYCQFKLRDLHLPHLPTQHFFGHRNLTLPSPLKSHPGTKCKKKSKLKWVKKSFNWMKGKSKGCGNGEFDDEISNHGGSNEMMKLSVYHPVIINTLLHLRDRDNAMVHLDHPAVQEGIQNCIDIPYNQEFLDSVNLIQSVDYSNNSLDDIYNDGDINNCLLANVC